jgi:glucose-1-phosphate adenylyltransferase
MLDWFGLENLLEIDTGEAAVPPTRRHGSEFEYVVDMQPRTFGIILAGGEGRRLMPLTADRAKPAVPFAGIYRLIDFALTNLVNGGLFKIAVLTQYKSHSLDRHVATAWRLSPLLGNYVTPVPAQMRRGPRWYAGSADAIYQSLNLVYDERPDHCVVFGADHIYRMDPRQMLDFHVESGAGVTVAGIRVPRSQASDFGVIETGPDGRGISAFLEKPKEAKGLPDAPDQIFASMGNYIFSTEALVDAVSSDATDENSSHDMGGDIIPALVERREAVVYDFSTNEVPGSQERDRDYWRDVGTLDTYYEAHLNLVSPNPEFNLYNYQWPILTWHEPLPPARFRDEGDRTGHAVNSMVCAGAIISGGLVRDSIISPDVTVDSASTVEASVLMQGVNVGPGATVRNAIVDKNVRIPAGAKIGVETDADRERFTVSPGGIVAIGKGQEIGEM